jgi:hypothetical protein
MQWKHTSRRWAAALCAAVMATTGLALVSGRPAGAVAIPTFSLSPVAVPGATAPRGSFHYNLGPGQTINDSIVLTNETTQLEQFQIWSTDGYNTAVGGAFALRPQGFPMTGVGTWINTHLGSGIYGLSGQTSVTINFSLTVPANATPGDHAGGVEALDVTPVAQPTTGPAHFVIHRGIATAVFIRVAGPVHPSASVSNIAVKTSVPPLGFGSSSAVVTYQLENTGNTLLAGQAVATVTDIFGRTVKTFPAVSVQAFVPGGRFTAVEPKWTSIPFIGPETVHVRITSPGLTPATGDKTFWIFPWLLVLLIVLILAAVVGRFWWGRRHPKAQAGGEPGPDGAATPGTTGPEGSAAVPEASVGSGA